jgi:hypothetical protein
MRQGLEQFQGEGAVMAKVILYYIPSNYRNKVKWIPPNQRGRVIDFTVCLKKSA